MAVQKDLLTVDDVHGAWCIIPTPSKPEASEWQCEDSVDYDEVARSVNGLIESGADAIMAQGTFGEGATLTWAEKSKMMEVMVETAAGRIPVFVGVTTLNTRDTITQLKFARDIGADGTMLGVPMWQQIDVPSAIKFYRDVAEAVPEMNIAIYANPEAFKFNFPTPFWAGVADIPQVITCKYINIAQLHLHTMVSRKKIRFLPIEFDHYDAARLDPEFHTAFWSPCANGGPELTMHVRDTVKAAIASGDWGDIFLDNQHHVLAYEELFFGTINASSVHPRVVIQRALHHNAAAIIVAHNHPSGISEPSLSDIDITKTLKTALALIDVRLIDHLVVASHQVTSLAERGQI